MSHFQKDNLRVVSKEVLFIKQLKLSDFCSGIIILTQDCILYSVPTDIEQRLVSFSNYSRPGLTLYDLKFVFTLSAACTLYLNN